MCMHASHYFVFSYYHSSFDVAIACMIIIIYIILLLGQISCSWVMCIFFLGLHAYTYSVCKHLKRKMKDAPFFLCSFPSSCICQLLISEMFVLFLSKKKDMHACSLAFHICSVLFSLSEKISQNFRHTSHQSSFHSFTVTNHPSTPIYSVSLWNLDPMLPDPSSTCPPCAGYHTFFSISQITYLLQYFFLYPYNI
jgi:hypothetical protein